MKNGTLLAILKKKFPKNRQKKKTKLKALKGTFTMFCLDIP